MESTRNTKTHIGNGLLVAKSLILAGLALFVLAGCQQPLQPGETYHKLTVVWPIFDVEKSEGIDENGLKWQKEKGDACCWLATWEKEYKYDKDGFRVYRKEKDGFFPIYSNQIEETEEFRSKQGAILLFPYQSYRVKTAGAEVK
jgi:hypothetical protein